VDDVGEEVVDVLVAVEELLPVVDGTHVDLLPSLLALLLLLPSPLLLFLPSPLLLLLPSLRMS
jgi:hypothetical protein